MEVFYMTDSIIDVLNLVDDDLIITDHKTINQTLYVELEKKLSPMYCPLCGSRMYSKGIYQRTINHPVLQDGRKVILNVKRRKWKCSSSLCNYMNSDNFKLFAAYKHSSNLLPLLVLKEMKDLTNTAEDIAHKLNVSDSTVITTFMSYVDLPRLPLSSVISIDEVYMNFDYRHKYPMVIIDFITGEPIDIVMSRREEDTNRYFLSIPVEERNNVQFLICDMYNPYIQYVKRYFPNAKAVVDCFHVTKYMIGKLDSYIYKLTKQFRERDLKLLEEKNMKSNREYKSIKTSKEVYILSKFKWVLLEKQSDIDYSSERKWCPFLNEYLDTFQKEKMFLDLDPHFRRLRELKEMYHAFDEDSKQHPEYVESKLNELISYYQNCDQQIFREFAVLLKKYRKEIILSYTFVDVIDKNGTTVHRRLSNAFIESFNRKPKDLKRAACGLANFQYARNRILWSTRNDPAMLAKPRDIKEFKVHTGKKRGHYKKQTRNV